MNISANSNAASGSFYFSYILSGAKALFVSPIGLGKLSSYAIIFQVLDLIVKIYLFLLACMDRLRLDKNHSSFLPGIEKNQFLVSLGKNEPLTFQSLGGHHKYSTTATLELLDWWLALQYKGLLGAKILRLLNYMNLVKMVNVCNYDIYMYPHICDQYIGQILHLKIKIVI